MPEQSRRSLLQTASRVPLSFHTETIEGGADPSIRSKVIGSIPINSINQTASESGKERSVLLPLRPTGYAPAETEHYPLRHNVPRVGQIKLPKWAKISCQTQRLCRARMTVRYFLAALFQSFGTSLHMPFFEHRELNLFLVDPAKIQPRRRIGGLFGYKYLVST
jgi:hypothetical protein